MAAVRKSSRLKTKETTFTYTEPVSDDESTVPAANGSGRKDATGPMAANPPHTPYEAPSEDDSDEVPDGPKRKRKAKASGKGAGDSNTGDDQRPVKRHRGKRGLLERMTELPMDLLFEIFGKLDPLDVLNLSRTTKALRAILLSRSSIAIWKECLANTGLPPCPEELNEPQWVDLVFGKHCQECARMVPQHLVWSARLRLCTRCLEDADLFSTDEDDRNTVPKQLVAYLPKRIYQSGARRRRYVCGYHLPTINKWVAEYAQASDKEAWVEAKVAECVVKQKHTQLCQEWERGEATAKGDKVTSERNARIAVVIAKLETAGFRENVENWRSNSFLEEKVVRDLVKKDVTDRAWTNAKDGIIAVANRYRQSRIEKQNRATIKTRHELLVTVYTDYVKTQPINAFVIPVANLFKTPEAQVVFASVPFDQDMTPEDFGDVFKNIALMSEQWVTESKAKLLEMARASLAKAFAPGSIPDFALDLAVARCFSTANFSPCISWDEALASRSMLSNHMASCIEDPEVKSFGNDTGEWPWNARNSIRFDAAQFDRALRTLKVIGHDPMSVSAQTLDELDEIFECTSCTSFDNGRHMMDWKAVMDHAHGRNHTYVKVDDEIANDVRSRMREASISSRARKLAACFACVHCRFSGNGSAMRTHLAATHCIVPATDEDAVLIRGSIENTARELKYWKFEGATLF